MKRKSLTDIEIGILEEIDAYNRAFLRTSTMDFCADCRVKGTEWMCGNDIIPILKSLSSRGYIDRRQNITMTNLGLAQIKRTKVIHFIDQKNVRKDGRGNVCNETKKCPDCKRVAKLKQAAVS